ncbi:MAG TPA: hypothetical protein VFQ47_03600 [Nitrososphaera sp.]|jgi:hypothetical protein|nr:hypothetical protein [Nitrososphaera sp.]
MRKTFILLVALFLLVHPEVALGCACIRINNVDEEFAKAAVVFSGKAVSEEYASVVNEEPFFEPKEIQVRVIRFEVEHWWKGGTTKQVILRTDFAKDAEGRTYNSTCNYHFQIGEQYLVYAFGSLEKLKTHSCSRTRKLERAENDLKELGPGSEPKEEKSSSSAAVAKPNNSLNRSANSIAFMREAWLYRRFVASG